MKGLLASLANLPDDMPCTLTVGTGPYTLGQLKQALAVEGVVEIGTRQAAGRWGRAPETWALLARNGMIEGAYQDGVGGPWRLPLESCERYIENRRKEASKPHGPRKAPQARRARPQGVPKGKVLPGGHASMGRRSLDDAKPRGPRLADTGREDRAS